MTTDHGPVAALAVDFSQAAGVLFSAGTVADTLAQLVTLAVSTIEGCDFAGVFIVESDVVKTEVHTDPVVVDLDALQHLSGEGPCLDAISDGVTFYADDLADDARWPHFGSRATAAGIRSLLTLPVYADGTSGALNLYARYPRAFGVIDRAKGQLLAALAGLALASVRSHEYKERQNANLHDALATRDVIGQAQGILIERERITADQAFEILRRASQHLNVKLREVAQTLVDTGESPDSGPIRHRLADPGAHRTPG